MPIIPGGAFRLREDLIANIATNRGLANAILRHNPVEGGTADTAAQALLAEAAQLELIIKESDDVH